MQPQLNIAIKAARAAGDVIIRHLEKLEQVRVSEKSGREYVSEVDLLAEQAIIQTIHKAYPEHGFIAEESGLHEGHEDYTWIIDPLDGTNNYLHGFPFYAVSIALKYKNKLEHAVVYDPLRHECFSASRGRGAQLNDRRIRVSKQFVMDNALLCTGFQINDSEAMKKSMPAFESMFGACRSVRRTGSAALDLAYVAAGRVDGFWDFNLRLWDIAAGILLIKEAGGMVSDVLGGEGYMQSGNVIAGNPKIFKSLIQKITPTVRNSQLNQE